MCVLKNISVRKRVLKIFSVKKCVLNNITCEKIYVLKKFSVKIAIFS